MPRRSDDDYGRPSSSRSPPPSQQGNQPSSNWQPPPAYLLAPNLYPAPGSLQPPPAPVEDLGFPETASRPLDTDFPASEYTYPPNYVPGNSCQWITREWDCPDRRHTTIEFRSSCWNHAGSTVRCPRTAANTLIQSVSYIPLYNTT